MCLDDDAFRCKMKLLVVPSCTDCCSLAGIAPAVFFLKGYVCVFVFSLLILWLISDLIRKTSVLSVIATLQSRLRPFLIWAGLGWTFRWPHAIASSLKINSWNYFTVSEYIFWNRWINNPLASDVRLDHHFSLELQFHILIDFFLPHEQTFHLCPIPRINVCNVSVGKPRIHLNFTCLYDAVCAFFSKGAIFNFMSWRRCAHALVRLRLAESHVSGLKYLLQSWQTQREIASRGVLNNIFMVSQPANTDFTSIPSTSRYESQVKKPVMGVW